MTPINDPVVVTKTGSRVDTLLVGGNRAFGPYQVSGVFSVSVTKSGYLQWKREGVEVQESQCGPITEHLDVFLEKAAVTTRLR